MLKTTAAGVAGLAGGAGLGGMLSPATAQAATEAKKQTRADRSL